MKIVKILGGLGNQMFQYALFLALREKFPSERILIDLSNFRGYPLHNGFELDKIFPISYEIATWKEILRVAYPYSNYRLWQIGKYLLPLRKTMCIEKSDMSLDQTVLCDAGDRYFDGYWQHEEYFKNIKKTIYQTFQFPDPQETNKEVIELVDSQNSVSLHVRRGDYIDHPFFRDICDINYYRHAIEFLEKNIRPQVYCIFSNDIEWCRSNIELLLSGKRVIYVNWNRGKDSFIDMQIMSHCNHNIIANSSFSWWGAWLNRNVNKVVISPSKWMNKQLALDPIPSDWIRL